MQWAKQKQAGFTIVELLIVVVVIAILAAITIVSYNGITNRANDSTVQSNLVAAGKRLEQHRIENGDKVPAVTDWEGMNIAVSQNSYSIGYWNGSGYYNFLYCRSDQTFALFAQAKSGKVYRYVSGQGVSETTSLGGSAGTCQSVGIINGTSPGYDVRWGYNAGAWTGMVRV